VNEPLILHVLLLLLAVCEVWSGPNEWHTAKQLLVYDESGVNCQKFCTVTNCVLLVGFSDLVYVGSALRLLSFVADLLRFFL